MPVRTQKAAMRKKTQSVSNSPAMHDRNAEGISTNPVPPEGALTAEEVSSKLIPSVVCIQNYQETTYSYRGGFFGNPSTNTSIELSGEGSGIVITADGYISTNAHVVNDADLLKVVMSDGTIYEAQLIGSDPDTDLAVIKIEAEGELKAAEFGDSDKLNAGQSVMAIGNPGGLELSSSVTVGIVSAVNRPVTLKNGEGYTMNTIQTDAAINPGNSGGALVNMYGQVVGIPSVKIQVTGYEGLGFAISVNEAVPVINDLMRYGKVINRGYLGITGMILDKYSADYYGLKEGLYVSSVENSSAGGLKEGDVITSVNGMSITRTSDLKNSIKGMSPGDTVEIEMYRRNDGKTHTATLTLQ